MENGSEHIQLTSATRIAKNIKEKTYCIKITRNVTFHQYTKIENRIKTRI